MTSSSRRTTLRPSPRCQRRCAKPLCATRPASTSSRRRRRRARRREPAAHPHRLPRARQQRTGEPRVPLLHHRRSLTDAARRPHPATRRSELRLDRGRDAFAHRAVHAGVAAGLDRCQRHRSRYHDVAGVRVARRDARLPHEPRARAELPQVPPAARHRIAAEGAGTGRDHVPGPCGAPRLHRDRSEGDADHRRERRRWPAARLRGRRVRSCASTRSSRR